MSINKEIEEKINNAGEKLEIISGDLNSFSELKSNLDNTKLSLNEAIDNLNNLSIYLNNIVKKLDKVIEKDFNKKSFFQRLFNK